MRRVGMRVRGLFCLGFFDHGLEILAKGLFEGKGFHSLGFIIS
jgi:hypothetical protein